MLILAGISNDRVGTSEGSLLVSLMVVVGLKVVVVVVVDVVGLKDVVIVDVVVVVVGWVVGSVAELKSEAEGNS